MLTESGGQDLIPGESADFKDCFTYSDSPEYNNDAEKFCQDWMNRYGDRDKCFTNEVRKLGEDYFFRVRTLAEKCHPRGVHGRQQEFYHKTPEYEGRPAWEDPRAIRGFDDFKDCFAFRDDYFNNYIHLDHMSFCKLWSDEWTGVPGKKLVLDDCIKHHADFLIPKDIRTPLCEAKGRRVFHPTEPSPWEKFVKWTSDLFG